MRSQSNVTFFGVRSGDVYENGWLILGYAVRAEEIQAQAVGDGIVLSTRVARPTGQKLYNDFFVFIGVQYNLRSRSIVRPFCQEI